MFLSRLISTPGAFLVWPLVACLGLVGGCACPAREHPHHETYEGNTARLSDLVPPQPPASLSGFRRTR